MYMEKKIESTKMENLILSNSCFQSFTKFHRALKIIRKQNHFNLNNTRSFD